MDVTISSPRTHGWELIAQLALYGQDDSTIDRHHLIHHLIEVLQTHVPCAWGLLVVVQDGQIQAHSSWGLRHEELHRCLALLTSEFLSPSPAHNNREHAASTLQGVVLPLRAGVEVMGYLVLASLSDEATPESVAFRDVLASQIGLLLQAQRRAIHEQLAATLQRLAHAVFSHVPLATLAHQALDELAALLVRYTQSALLLNDNRTIQHELSLSVLASRGDPLTDDEITVVSDAIAERLYELRMARDISPFTSAIDTCACLIVPIFSPVVSQIAETSHRSKPAVQESANLAHAASSVQECEPDEYAEEASITTTVTPSLLLGALVLKPRRTDDERAKRRETVRTLDYGIARAVAYQVAQAIANQRVQELHDDQVHQLHVMHRRASIFNDVLKIGQVQWIDGSLDDLLDQIGRSVVALSNFRTVLFFMVDPDAPELVWVVTGFGLSNDALQRIRASAFPLHLIQRYLDPRFRIGLGFFVPAEAASEVERGFEPVSAILNETITATVHHFAEHAEMHPAPLFNTLWANDSTTQPQKPWQQNDKLFLPLYGTGGGLLGLMAVFNPIDDMRPIQLSVEPLEILADHATSAIENHYLLSAAHAQTDQMTALYHIGASAASTVDLDILLQGIGQQIFAYLARRRVGERTILYGNAAAVQRAYAPTVYIATYLPQHDQIRFDLFMQQDSIVESFHKTVMSKAGLLGWIIDHGRPVLIRDLHKPMHASSDSTIAQSLAETDQHAKTSMPDANDPGVAPPAIPDEHIRSWLGVPLRSQNRVLGVLVMQDIAPNIFSDRDRQFFDALANQLAIAIENIRLFQEREQRIAELNVINRVGRIATSRLDTMQMLEEAYDCLSNFLPADACNIVIYAADQQRITFSFVETQLASGEHSRTVSATPYSLQAGSLMNHIITTHQPLLLHTLPHDLPLLTPNTWATHPVFDDPALPPLNHRATTGAWMGVPLLVSDDHVVGAIGVQSNTPDRYGERELSFISTVASQLALGIQNAQLLAQAQEQVQQLGLLNRLSSVATSMFELEPVYQMVVDAMVQATDVDHARMTVYERDIGVARIVTDSRMSLPETPYEDTQQDEYTTIPLHENPAFTWLNEHCSPLVSTDAQHDPLFLHFRHTFEMLDIQSIALVPLIRGDEVIGSVELGFVGRQVHFNAQQLEFCQTIANQMTTVIEKAQLFAQTQSTAYALQVKVGELSTLLEAANILSSLLQPDEVLSSLMDLVVRQLDVTTAALWIIGKDSTLTPAAMCGVPDDEAAALSVPIGTGLTGKIVESGAPLIVRNVEHEGSVLYPTFNQRYRLVSYMGVPVFYRDTIVGVLSVMSTKQRDFTDDEMMLLNGLAGEAAVALENARLFQEREQRINELLTINDISTEVNTSLRLDELLMALHEGISDILDTRYSFIGIYEKADIYEVESRLRLRLVRDGGDVHLTDETIQIDGKGPIDYVILESKPLRMENGHWVLENGALLDYYPSSTHKSPFLTEGTFKSGMFIPIVLRGDMLGVIALRSHDPFAYSADDVRFLSTITSQAAVAIANAHLFTERERRLREMSVLKDIGGAIASTLDLNSVLERLHHELSQAIDVSTSLIGLYDERTGVLSYPICYDQGKPSHFAPSLLPDDANGWVIRNRQPLLLHTVEQSRQIGFSDFGLSVFDLRSGQSRIRLSQSRVPQSFLVVPIISGDSVLGVINIQSYQSYAFDDDDLRFVIAVANQVAVTISNVHLFVERGRRIEELEIFNEIGRALSSTMSIDEMPELIYRQTSRLLDTTNFSMAILDEANDTITFPLFFENGERQEFPASNGIHRAKAHESDTRFHTLGIYLARRVIHRREPMLLQGSDMERGGWIVDIQGFMDEVSYSFLTMNSDARSSEPAFKCPRSWLGVPMISADKVLGVIAIQDFEHPNAYGSHDVRLLSTIASWAATALEKARLFNEISTLAADLEQRVTERTIALEKATKRSIEERDRLATVHAITRELTATLDLDKIISRALEMVSSNLEVSRGSILLRDLQSDTLVCRAVLRNQGVVDSVNAPLNFAGRESLVDWVIQNQEAVCIDDVRIDRRWVVEEGRGEDARSVVAVPLATSDTILGVLILSNPTVGYFGTSQMRLLETIAHEVAIALNNAQLYGYITEMATRLAELLEQHKEEASKSSAILQSLTEGVIVLDNEQRIALINLAAEHILDISASEVLVQPLSRLAEQGKTDVEYARARMIYDALATGFHEATVRQGIYTMSFELPEPHQTISVNLAPVMTQDGLRYGDVAVLRDITAEIEANRAKREFISKVSHELRTPLTAIKGYVDMALLPGMGPIDQQQKIFLQVIQNNANRLMALINDILDISKLESGKIKLQFAEVDLCKVIQDVVQSWSLEAHKKQQTVRIDIAENLPCVMADEKSITQVIFNLFSNAVKYTYDHGSITIRAFLNPANMMQIDVEDTGVGMSPEQCKHLFLPFYRADNPLADKAKGTGLGLTISKALVEQHNGEMWVTSEQNKGSIFSFILPLQQPEASDDEAQEDTP